MKLNEVRANEGARKEPRRLGRGIGSGLGKTSGKGHKGQNARSGGGVRPGFEGGQNPIYRRVSKRGFNNYEHRLEYAIVNLSSLDKFNDNDVVNAVTLFEKGMVKKELSGIKILGNGTLTKKLTVIASKFSKAAEEAIVKNGGKVEVI